MLIFEKDLKLYETLLSDAKDKELYEKEKGYFAEYNAMLEKLFVLSRNNQKAEIDVLLQKSSAIPQNMTQTIDEHMNYNKQLAEVDAKGAIDVKVALQPS